MSAFIQPPFALPLALVLAGIGVLAAGLSIRRFRQAYRTAGHYRSALWVLRGIRCLVIALTGGAWAAGIYWGLSWPLIIGLVFLGQELYECFVLSATLREGQRLEGSDAGSPAV